MTAGEAGKLLKTSDFPFWVAKYVADLLVESAGLYNLSGGWYKI